MDTLLVILDLALRSGGPQDSSFWRMMDVGIQRLKSIERATLDGHWKVSRWMELVPSPDMGSLGMEEETLASKTEMAYQRSHRSISSVDPNKWSPPGGGNKWGQQKRGKDGKDKGNWKDQSWGKDQSKGGGKWQQDPWAPQQTPNQGGVGPPKP